MATAPKSGSGTTAPDDKTDPREPDTTADKRTDSTASVPTDVGVDETDAALNSKYGFSTIDTSDVSHDKPDHGDPVPVDQVSASAGASIVDGATSHRNSTFADRAKERDKRSNTAVSRETAQTK
jgi:hypothetical protein